MTVCKGMTLKGTKCKKKCKPGSDCCTVHAEMYKLAKPEECPVCYDPLSETLRPFKCGHYCCTDCVSKSKTPGKDVCCPMCRSVVKKSTSALKSDWILPSVIRPGDVIELEIIDDEMTEEDIERMSNTFILWLMRRMTNRPNPHPNDVIVI